MGNRTTVSIGNKYFKLTVIDKAGKDKHCNLLWKCLCDCGEQVIVKSTSLTMKVRPTRSCGCYQAEVRQLEPGLAAANSLYRRYLKRDFDAHRISNLTMDAFLKLTKSPCFYCGSLPTQTLSFKTTNGEYVYNGIDRVDNSLGYSNTNVVACCGPCNYMKGTQTLQEFLDRIKTIYTRTNSWYVWLDD